MLKEAMEAIRQGQRPRARDLLARLLRADQSNAEYWLWMSSVVDSFKEQVYCLQSVLKLDADNRAARQGLVLLGAVPADQTVTPVPPVRRQWKVAVQEIPKTRLWENLRVRIVVYTAATLLVVGAIIMGVMGVNTKRSASLAFIPTRTPGPSPTYTNTPTASNYTPIAPTRTPKSTGPPPLWTLLKATYTPTPVYIATAHQINEAYRVGQRALGRGQLDLALENFEQAMQMEPDAADLPYFIGEIYRIQRDFETALSFYEKTIEIDPEFAPAYLGRARALLGLDPKTEVLQDLEDAIEIDPGYGEAYLELADYLLEHNEIETALEHLDTAAEILPGSPLMHLHRAQAYILLGEKEQALEEARLSNQQDLTLLPSYRVLGQAAALNGEFTEAFEALDTYLQYEQRDAKAWTIYGEALFATSQYTDTLQAMDTALKLDRSLAEAYYTKGLAYIELGEGQKGVNEIYRAIQLKPNTFAYQLNFARALFVAERLEEAAGAMYPVERMAETDSDLAQVYYWRALMLEAQGEIYLAQRDWRKLLQLEEDVMPVEWREIAEERIAKTPTPAPTRTPTPTATSSPTTTRTLAPKPTATPSGRVTASPTPTPGSF